MVRSPSNVAWSSTADADVVSHRPHRPGRRPFGGGRREPSNDSDRDEHGDQRGEAVGEFAVVDQIGEAVGERLGLDDHGERGDRCDRGDDHEVGAQRRDQPDQAQVDRAAPVDVAHRWTIGRCWVPMRLRKTQYVQPWYSNTTGVMTSATIVITFKV